MAGMKPGYKSRCLLVCACMGALFSLPAQANVLADALEHAWARHPQANALEARTGEAAARSEIARGLTPGPAALSLGLLDDRIGSRHGKQEWEVELATPLWLPGQKAALAGEAARLAEQVEAKRAALRLELAGELRAAAWALTSARQTQELAQRRLASARALESDVLRRYRTGDLARIDANLARNETLSAQTDSLQADAALRQAERVWRNLTGMAAPARIEAEMLPELPEPTDRDASINVSNLQHAQLAAALNAEQIAQARLKLAGTTRRDAPEIGLRLQRERGDNSEAFSHAIGIQLTLPFSSGPRLRHETAAAQADLLQATAEQVLTRQRLDLGVAQARHELALIEQQGEIASIQRGLTADTLALAETAFRLGESDLAGLLRARAAAFEAEARLSRQTAARGQAISQLKQALGQMP
jgi:outer membrane protein TolC